MGGGAGTGTLPIRTTGVIPYLADSTLLPDFGANALLVLALALLGVMAAVVLYAYFVGDGQVIPLGLR